MDAGHWTPLLIACAKCMYNKFIRAYTQTKTVTLHTYANFNANGHSNLFHFHSDAIFQVKSIFRHRFPLKLTKYFRDFCRRIDFAKEFNMEPATKRIKFKEKSPPSSTASEMQFLDLNDDCIFDIFDRLSTIDWCSMSFTCERLQTLALDHFQRKFPDEAVTIQKYMVQGKVSYRFSSSNGYPVKLIPNVKMANVPPAKRLFEFIKAEGCPKLKTLSITASLSIPVIGGEVIKSQLKDLESLAVFKLNSKTNIYNVFLKHCPKIEHLTIETTEDWKANWMLHRYPELKSLSFLVDCNKPYRGKFGELAGQFFRNNSQLKDISCIGGWSMNPILLNASKIESLAIEIKWYDNLAEILDNLKNYCQQSPIECLEFDITNVNSLVEALKMLKEFNEFHPIHGLSVTFNYDKNHVLSKEVMCNIVSLKQLRDLDISYSDWLEVEDYDPFVDFWKLLAKELLHLEELKLPAPFTRRWIALEAYIAPFVRNSKKMKKLTLHKCMSYDYSWWCDFKQTHLINMRADRLRLSGACSMDIHFVTSGGFVQKFIIPSIIKDAK